MNAFQAYSASTAGWLAIQAVPMLISPNAINDLFSNTSTPSTTFEENLWRAMAVGELALAFVSLLISGVIPGMSSANEDTKTGALAERIPAKTAILMVTELCHLISFMTAYAKFSNDGPKLNLLLVVGAGLMSLYGAWVLLFGGDGGKDRKSSLMFPSAEKRARKTEKREKKFEKLEGRFGKRSSTKSE